MFERIKRYYEKQLWTAGMVRQAAEKGLLSEVQYTQIVGPAADGPAEEAADE